MTEKQLRNSYVEAAEGWLGCKESDGSHMLIVDLYNGHSPLARGYKVKKNDSRCAAFVSAAAIKAGLTSIIPLECGCGEMIKLFQKMGRWQENDGYIPQTGDVIFYDWDDSGKGDNTGWPEHVGIVVSVSGSNIKVIEGNKSDAVGYRNIAVNGRYIRGYGVPDYGSLATPEKLLEVDGRWGVDTTIRLQEIFGTTVDGKISNQPLTLKLKNPGLRPFAWEFKLLPKKSGSQLIKAIQKKLGVTVTGVMDAKTIKAMQKWLGTKQDGYVSNPSSMVKALQRWCNKQ